MLLMQAVKTAGGTSVEKKLDIDEENKEMSLDKSEDIELSSLSQPPEDSSSDEEEDREGTEYTTPLMSAEEAEPQSEEEEGPIAEKVELKETSYNEKKLTREHKLRLLVTKGCVIAVSCTVLVVGVVLAGVLRHDYSSCDEWVVETSLLHSSLLLPTPTPVFVQPAS